MERLMIVEDEKLIRQGIRAMAERSGISVGEIVECRNGLEALTCIQQKPAQVVITDIKMPKMDGITLVKELQKLSDVPKVVVVSGYDDFSYAVELLRCGAREYLLKPIKRGEIAAILKRLDKEIEEEQLQNKENVMAAYEQVRHVLLSDDLGDEELNIIQHQVEDCVGDMSYVIVCTSYFVNKKIISQDAAFFQNIGGHHLLFLRPRAVAKFLEEHVQEEYVGISHIGTQLARIKELYEEAVREREKKFCMQKRAEKDSKLTDISETEIERFIQLTGTARLEDADRYFVSLVQKTKRGEYRPQQFSSGMEQIAQRLKSTYAGIISSEGLSVDMLQNVYNYMNIDEYYEAFGRVMAVINQRMNHEYDDYRNRLKIGQAVSYIGQNYNHDINMAMVSNEISMNYSAFSLAFKEVTGQNFVNYLREIRMQKAKQLLDETDKRVLEISTLIGYEDEKHFMKSFKSMYGVTPSEYRKNIQMGKK